MHKLEKLSNIEPIKNYTNDFSMPRESSTLSYENQNTRNYDFQYSSLINENNLTTKTKNNSMFSPQLNNTSNGTADNLNCISFNNTSTTYNPSISMPFNHLNTVVTSNINSYETTQQIQQAHNLPISTFSFFFFN